MPRPSAGSSASCSARATADDHARRLRAAPFPLLLVSFGCRLWDSSRCGRHDAGRDVDRRDVFATGAGLTTLARPYLVLQYTAPSTRGHNGVIARGQQLARAAGPVSAAAIASAAGYGKVFAALAALLVAAIVVTPIRRT